MQLPRSPIPILCALLAVASCQGMPACGGGRLAEVAEAHGRVERDFADRRTAWQPAEIGAELRRGDGLRTGPKATAVLRVGRGGTLHVESDTTLRMTLPGDRPADDSPSAAPEIEVEAGQVVLEAGDSPLPITTGSGSAVLRAGSRLQLSRAERGVRYDVVIGGAAFRQADGKTAEVGAGQSIVVGIGLAVLDSKAQGQTVLAAIAPGAAVRASVDAGTAQAADPKPADAPGAVQAVVSGSVRRRARGAGDWAELARGVNALGAGDELDVGKAGRAEIARGEERATLSQGRYEIGAADAPLVRARDGKLLVSAERIPVAVSVPGGTIVVQAAPSGSRADIAVDGEHGTTEIEVLAGQVKAAGPEGETLLEEGEHGKLAAAAASKHAPVVSRRADQPELVVRVGESFRVYDPSPPVAIGFSLGKRCPGGAELRIEGMEAMRGQRQINALVGPGLRGYSVHCISGGQAERRATISSSLRVLRSEGTRRPPTKPAGNNVDLDGRNYTLMYQNLRPILSVRWPAAPKASGYTLRVERPDGNVISVRAKQPRATVEPHQLADGVHKLRFETSGGGATASSKETRVNLLFDNAAPTASLQQPPPAGFAAGDSVPVSGVAVAGSSAKIGTRTIAVDRAGRFSTQVQLKPGQQAIAIRFRHPKHGIRYYLRRAREGER